MPGDFVLTDYLQVLIHNNYFLVSISLLVSFVISWIAMPSLLSVAREKNLVDRPNGRTSHKGSVPNLGGVALFASLIITVLTFTDLHNFPSVQYITPGLVILFFTGLKDDVLAISPYTKLMSQILSASIVVVIGNIRFTSLHGCIGIYEIPYLASVTLTIFVIVVIINCFNLFDGIDGLASGMGIVASLAMGTYFFINHQNEYVMVSATLIGALTAFFYYNVFSKKNKIFLGDTGAMILGYMMAILVIGFNEFNVNARGIYSIDAAPAVSISILFLPLFDVARVFTLRIINGQSPFRADKRHLHHLLIGAGMSHIKATSILLASQVVIIIIGHIFRNIAICQLTTLLILLGMLFSTLVKMNFNKYNAIKKYSHNT